MPWFLRVWRILLRLLLYWKINKLEHIYLSGKCKWCRTQTPDEYFKWKITLWPDAESMVKVNKLKEEGIKNILKKDEDGYYITFNRPTSVMRKGKVVGMEPPIVLNKEGTAPLMELVGNGSDVTVKLEIYGGKVPTGMGSYKAARFLSVRVNNLVPFQRDSFNEGEQKAVKGLAEQPEQVF